MVEELYTEEINRETRNRIQLALAAYAYEVENDPIMSDGEFDILNRSIDLTVDTRRPDLDKWFRKHWSNNTGSWVWRHPDFNILGSILERRRKKKWYLG